MNARTYKRLCFLLVQIRSITKHTFTYRFSTHTRTSRTHIHKEQSVEPVAPRNQSTCASDLIKFEQQTNNKEKIYQTYKYKYVLFYRLYIFVVFLFLQFV